MNDAMDDAMNAAMMEEFAPADPGALIEPEVWAALEEMGYSPDEIRSFYAYAASDAEPEPAEADVSAPAEPRRWEPTDLDGADWVLRRIREKEEAAALIAGPYDKEIERLTARIEELKEEKARNVRQFEMDRDFFLARYGDALETVARVFLEDSCSKRKSVSLPNGTLAFRKKQASVDVIDAPAAANWAQNRGLARTKIELDKTAVKKYLAEHPEDGTAAIIYTGPYDEFKITAKSAGEAD